MALRRKGQQLPWRAKPKPKESRKSKFKNEPVTAYGIDFKSKIELKFYDGLKNLGIDFKYNYCVDLTRPTIRKGKKILTKRNGFQQVKMYVDFHFTLGGVRYYIDTKGSKNYIDPVSKLKYRLLGFVLYERMEYDSMIRFVDYKDIDGVLLQLREIKMGKIKHL